MPELPEVETVARQLDASTKSLTMEKLIVNDDKLSGIKGKRVKGSRIDWVRRIGKQVVFKLANPKTAKSQFIAVHLRMTGRLIYQKSGQSADEKPPRAEFKLKCGSILFKDTRRFGTITFADELCEIEPVGIDPTSDGFTKDKLAELINSSKVPLKDWLLKQDKICGIGNIYASEICFKAKLSPVRPAGLIDNREIVRLHKAIKQVLAAAIKNCGTTFSDFQDSNGEVGGYQKYLKVYKREGEACRSCKGEIKREVIGQRSTFYCPACQK